jgi:hypothetical protein
MHSKHIRNVTAAPFATSADGWGEFPIHIQIFPRVGSSVKCVHYLKLDSVKDVVVNESFDYLILPVCLVGINLFHSLSGIFNAIRSPSTITCVQYPCVL